MAGKADPGQSSVVPLRPERLSIAEQQMLARRAARTGIPTKQRDFSELWGEEQPKRGKRIA